MIETGKVVTRACDDAHTHTRQKGDTRFRWNVQHIVQQVKRAVVMGNNVPLPIMTAAQMLAHKADIMEVATEAGHPDFEPLMTVMATPDSTEDMIEEAFEAGAFGLKIMPGKGSTNTDHAISDYYHPRFRDCLKVAQRRKKPTLWHMELPFEKDGTPIPEALRSKRFIPIIKDILSDLPDLRVCVEHIDIKELVQLVLEGGPNMFATVTPHHMEVNKDQADQDIHLRCMPYPKERPDIEAVLDVVMNGHPQFGWGSDNALHTLLNKIKLRSTGVCLGPVLLPATFEIFERHGAVERFEAFTSEFFARWHGLPLNQGTITLVREPWDVPEQYELEGGDQVVSYRHGERINWRIAA